MRKIQPAFIKQDFAAQLTALNSFYDTGSGAFSAAVDQSTFVESCLLVMAVAWEGFVSDMFIAYINGDATCFKQHLETSFVQHLKSADKPFRVYTEFGSIKFPVHLTKTQVQSFADTEGNNITFSDFGKLEAKARTWLSPAHAAKFKNLPASLKATINVLIAMRNHVAHRSQRSLNAMNEKTAAAALYQTGLQRQQYRFHQVGAWLKAIPPNKQESRFALLLAALRRIEAMI